MIKAERSCAVWSYRDWWGQEFRCVNWRQRLNRRCQSFLSHGLRRSCCEFSWPFKRRDRWQADQDMEESHRSLSQGQESSRRVASQCCASFPLVGCVGKACTCYSCNFSSSRALFSTASNVMTKKCSCLTCDNMEEWVYLHEVWPKARPEHIVPLTAQDAPTRRDVETSRPSSSSGHD